MPSIDKIDVKKSLKKQRLVFHSNWNEIADSVLFYINAAFFIYCLITLYDYVNFESGNDKVAAYFILPLLIIFTLILIFKKLIEKRLTTIGTPLNAQGNRKYILDFVKKEEWKIKLNNREYLRARTGFDFDGWGYQITFIFQDNKILLNVIRDNPKVRIPVLFKQSSLKTKLRQQIALLLLETR